MKKHSVGLLGPYQLSTLLWVSGAETPVEHSADSTGWDAGDAGDAGALSAAMNMDRYPLVFFVAFNSC